MASITVGELWRLALPPEARLIAGREGLDREVTWTAVLRTRPPAFQSLKGGELLLISRESLRLLDPTLSIVRLLESVTRMGVAGALVAGEVDPESATLAQRERLPVFELAETTHLGDLERSLIRAIVDYRNEIHQRTQEISHRMMELAIEGRGTHAIADEVALVTGRVAVLEDEMFQVSRISVPPHEAAPPEIDDGRLARANEQVRDWIRAMPLSVSAPPIAEFPIPESNLGRLVVPVITRQGIRGYLSLLNGSRPFDEIDRVAVVRGSIACAIEAAREQAVVEAADRAQGTFIDDLLADRVDSVAALRARARRLGLDPDARCVALAFATEPDRLSLMASLLEREGDAGRLGILTRAVDDQVTALVTLAEGTDERGLKTAIGDLVGRLATRLGGQPVSVGVGRPRDQLPDFPASHTEALGALQLGIQLFGAGAVTYFADLGIYRLLLAVRESTDLQTFYEETLGKLADYDRRSDGDLLRTLEVYFACHASPTEAAERLHVHRNTLLYRLGRIRTISGLDLDDPETRLAVQLALRVRRILCSSSR